MIFAEIQTNMRKSLTKFCGNFEFGAVQRCVSVVDLEKCVKHGYMIAKIALDTEANERFKVC